MTFLTDFAVGAFAGVASLCAAQMYYYRRKPAPVAVTPQPRHVKIIRPPYDQDAPS